MRKQLSATVSSGNSPVQSTSKNMLLNSASGFNVGNGATKYSGISGTISDSSLLNLSDVSDPTNGDTFVCGAMASAGLITAASFAGVLPNVSHNFVLTLHKNGVATALVITITSADDDGNGNAKKILSGLSIAFVAGDLLAWEWNNASGTTAISGSIGIFGTGL